MQLRSEYASCCLAYLVEGFNVQYPPALQAWRRTRLNCGGESPTLPRRGPLTVGVSLRKEVACHSGGKGGVPAAGGGGRHCAGIRRGGTETMTPRGKGSGVVVVGEN
jgi:hypothetical protein